MSARQIAPDGDVPVFRGVVEGTREVREWNVNGTATSVVKTVPVRRVFGPYAKPGTAKGVARREAWGLVDIEVYAERGETVWTRIP